MDMTRLRRAANLPRRLREWRDRRGDFWDDSLPNHDGDAFVFDLRVDARPNPPEDVLPPGPVPARRHGRHRLPPQPATVRFPATMTTIPRVTPACGTRPPWDTASFPEVPASLAAGEGLTSGDDPDPGHPDDATDTSGQDHQDSPADPGEANDELQRYLNSLPGYPDD